MPKVTLSVTGPAEFDREFEEWGLPVSVRVMHEFPASIDGDRYTAYLSPAEAFALVRNVLANLEQFEAHVEHLERLKADPEYASRYGSNFGPKGS